MHLLYLEWNSYANTYIKKAFKNRGHSIITFPFPASSNCKNNPELCTQLVTTILSSKIDCCFSINYFPIVAIACKACNIKYISWTYDSPYAYLYSDTIFYETNYAFIFDRHEVNTLKNLGAETVYHLPMAIPDQSFIDSINHSVNKVNYFSDVSMIGSMYSEEKHRFMDKLSGISQYSEGYLRALVDVQKYLYGVDIITEALTPSIVDEINKFAPLLKPDDELQTKAWVYSRYFLMREVTRLERSELIDALSQKHSVSIYTYESLPKGSKAAYRGPLDYYKEAPIAMNKSKINLNISLRSIITGIPLRAFDILGAGGFLLSNYQEELLDYFVPNEDFVYFDSPSDLLEKVDYYLTHEDERKKISVNGANKAQANHTYNHRIAEIERIVQE